MKIRTPELEDVILTRIAEGETLRAICRDLSANGINISHRTVSAWTADEQFAERMYEARLQQMWAFADEIVEISDDSRRDQVDDDGVRRVDHDHIQRSRLRVDTRKFLMMKIAPRIFGDKLELSGKDGGPLQHEAVIRFVRAEGGKDGA